MTPGSQHTAAQRGVVYGVAAYLIWGLLPLYLSILEPAGPVEILAHRIVWSMVFILVLLFARRSWSFFRAVARDRRRLTMTFTAAAVISLNWGVYNWAVLNGHVVDGSLGYFINPLVTVLFGVLILRERLRPAQWAAVAVAAVAVTVLTVDAGVVPWIGLIVSATFATYGLIKKFVGMPPLESLAVETSFMAPAFVVVLLVMQAQGTLVYGSDDPWKALQLMGVGIASVVPLLMFGAAMPRLPLTTMGLLQYLTPVTQFVCGVLVFDEAMSTGRWIGFAIVWLSLTVFTADAWRQARVNARTGSGSRGDGTGDAKGNGRAANAIEEAELAPEPT